jgi:hypothetical protein
MDVCSQRSDGYLSGMTSTEYQALAVYCVFAYALAARVQTGNLLVRLGLALALFFIVPAFTYAWKHRAEMISQ